MTEVQSGPNPTFRHQIPGDGYELKIVGYHTTDPDWTAGGAVDWKYDSAQAAKRRVLLCIPPTGPPDPGEPWARDPLVGTGGDFPVPGQDARSRGGPSAVQAWIGLGTGLDRGLGERVVSALR